MGQETCFGIALLRSTKKNILFSVRGFGHMEVELLVSRELPPVPLFLSVAINCWYCLTFPLLLYLQRAQEATGSLDLELREL